MSFILICREDIKEKIEKLHFIEKITKERGFNIDNIVALPLAQWAGKVDEVFIVPHGSAEAPYRVDIEA